MKRLLAKLFSIFRVVFHYAVNAASNNFTNGENSTTEGVSSENVLSTVSTGLSSTYNITRVGSSANSSLSAVSVSATTMKNSSLENTVSGPGDELVAYITYFTFFSVPAVMILIIYLAIRISMRHTDNPPPRRVVRHFLAPVLLFDDDDDSGCGSSISQSIVSSDTSNNGSVAEENDEVSSNVSGASGGSNPVQQLEEENAVIAGGVSEDDISNMSRESYYDNVHGNMSVEGACGVVEDMHLRASDENMSIELEDISVVSFNGHNIAETIM
ncbi:hypothetical protein [Ehrlichia ruminantium]|nr:hypothetical protein [Ehrlichia ruminantium]